MNKPIVFLFCLFFPAAVAFAQQPRLGGVRLENEKYKTIPLKSIQKSSPPGSAKTLRNSFEMMPMDQGHVLACACYSIAHAYGIRRKLHFDFKCPTEVPFELFSASYLFNQICPDRHCDSGVYLSEALDTLLSQGICPARAFPNDRFGCDSLPLPKHRVVADSFRILRYKRVFKLESECMTEPDYPDFFKNEIRNSAIGQIDIGNPVLVVLLVTPDFGDCPDGRNWVLPKEEAPVLGHAMVLVGYDDIRQEFELLNSFGPDWCDSGFVHISYEDFALTARYGYVMDPDWEYLNCMGK